MRINRCLSFIIMGIIHVRCSNDPTDNSNNKNVNFDINLESYWVRKLEIMLLYFQVSRMRMVIVDIIGFFSLNIYTYHQKITFTFIYVISASIVHGRSFLNFLSSYRFNVGILSVVPWPFIITTLFSEGIEIEY